MIAALVFLAVAAATGFGYLYLAARYRWGQQPANTNTGWDGVERRTIRSRPHPDVSDAVYAEWMASLAAEYRLVGAR